MKKIVFISLVLATFSCEKEIEVAVNDSESLVVIKASVSTEPDASLVQLSKSLNLNDPLPYPSVSDATVSITDMTTDENFVLSETEAGLYTNPNLQGIEGHIYTLNVTIDGNSYTATSTVPQKVELQGLEQTSDSSSENAGGGPGGPNLSDGNFVKVVPVYTDPEASTDYYQLVVSRNDTILGDVFILSDFAMNGVENTRSLNIQAEVNDMLNIDLQGVDKTVYDYLLGLNENINQSSATPTNPISNIGNGALGYFKAHTSSKQLITIQ